jgi:hypothetical protein
VEAGEDRLHELHAALDGAQHKPPGDGHAGKAAVDEEDGGLRVGRRPLPGAQRRAQPHHLLLQRLLRRRPLQRGVEMKVNLK